MDTIAGRFDAFALRWENAKDGRSGLVGLTAAQSASAAKRRSMIVTFRSSMPLAETMCFETVYEENLQMDEDGKQGILDDGLASWMFVDGILAGEIYGVSAAAVDEEIEDLTVTDSRTIYCYSTTILPAFQGQGLSKILVARWNGMAAGAGFNKITGHATSAAMVAVRAFFGARFGAVHRNWYDTDRTAHFYEQAP